MNLVASFTTIPISAAGSPTLSNWKPDCRTLIAVVLPMPWYEPKGHILSVMCMEYVADNILVFLHRIPNVDYGLLWTSSFHEDCSTHVLGLVEIKEEGEYVRVIAYNSNTAASAINQMQDLLGYDDISLLVSRL